MKLDMRKLIKINNNIKDDEGWRYVPDLEYFGIIEAELYLLGCIRETGLYGVIRTPCRYERMVTYVAGEEESDNYKVDVPQLNLTLYKELTT